MRKSYQLVLALFFSALALPCAADEIIFLKSGATLPIITHEVRDNMIHVDLGGNGFMAFPMAQVEKIEKAGGRVVLHPSSVASNVVSPGAYVNAELNHPASVSSTLRTRKGDPRVVTTKELDDPNVETGDYGLAVYKPTPHGSRAKSSLAFTGRTQIRSSSGSADGGYRGATRVGNRYIIGNPNPRRSSSVSLVGLQRKQGVARPEFVESGPEPPKNDAPQPDTSQSGSED